jgi:hypothetical protein
MFTKYCKKVALSKCGHLRREARHIEAAGWSDALTRISTYWHMAYLVTMWRQRHPLLHSLTPMQAARRLPR